jgi:hypothetical protein|uniref:Uncharacterized protein n=1 Tax=Populus trichocarpa TaxID=3694 RepID=A0A2K2BXY9_POPTR
MDCSSIRVFLHYYLNKIWRPKDNTPALGVTRRKKKNTLFVNYSIKNKKNCFLVNKVGNACNTLLFD